jgi:hypothetical protein
MTGNLGLDEKTGNQIEARVLNAAAQRALAEAEARRAEKQEATRPAEIGGRDGPEPIRYGDWEVKGIASDF